MDRRVSIMVSAFLCAVLSIGAKAESLTDILKKYCVPTSGYCSNIATYVPGDKNVASFCRCSEDYQYYNSGIRSCEDCITGSYPINDYTRCDPITCPEGYVAKLITVDTKTKTGCPDGFALKQINVDVGCGDGFKLKTYNRATKTFY